MIDSRQLLCSIGACRPGPTRAMPGHPYPLILQKQATALKKNAMYHMNHLFAMPRHKIISTGTTAMQKLEATNSH